MNKTFLVLFYSVSRFQILFHWLKLLDFSNPLNRVKSSFPTSSKQLLQQIPKRLRDGCLRRESKHSIFTSLLLSPRVKEEKRNAPLNKKAKSWGSVLRVLLEEDLRVDWWVQHRHAEASAAPSWIVLAARFKVTLQPLTVIYELFIPNAH